MTETITLAHLSDIHLSPLRGPALRQLNVKRGLGYLNWQRSRRRVHLRAALDMVSSDLKEHRPDHIAVTGDLINLGLPAEYEAALSWLKGLGDPDFVTVIPGNHDIYTNLRGDPGVKRWSDYMRADAWGAQLVPENAPAFPFVRRIGPVALICLNSAVETPPFVAAGELGARQLAILADLLEQIEREGLVRVILIHHPPLPNLAPPRRALRDADKLARVLEEKGAELILHGHNHRDHHLDFTWARGRVPVIGVASGSTARVHKDEPLGRYNLLRISRNLDGVHIECTTRGLDPTASLVEHVDHKLIA